MIRRWLWCIWNIPLCMVSSQWRWTRLLAPRAAAALLIWREKRLVAKDWLSSMKQERPFGLFFFTGQPLQIITWVTELEQTGPGCPCPKMTLRFGPRGGNGWNYQGCVPLLFSYWPSLSAVSVCRVPNRTLLSEWWCITYRGEEKGQKQWITEKRRNKKQFSTREDVIEK